MKQVILILFAYSILTECKNVNTPIINSDLSVKAEIIGRVTCCPDTHDFDDLIVKIVVLNNSIQPKSFWIMKCSWGDSFKSNRKDIILNQRECVGNYPKEITLNHEKTITFYTTLEQKSKYGSVEPDTFRIGLMLFDENDFSSFDKIYNTEYQNTKKTYWSNLLTFEELINGYFLDD